MSVRDFRSAVSKASRWLAGPVSLASSRGMIALRSLASSGGTVALRSLASSGGTVALRSLASSRTTIALRSLASSRTTIALRSLAGVALILLVATGCGSKKKTGALCQGGSDCGSGICYNTQCVATCAEQHCGSNRLCVLISNEPLCVPEENLSITDEAKKTIDVPHYSTEDMLPFPDGWNSSEDNQTPDSEQPDTALEDSGADVDPGDATPLDVVDTSVADTADVSTTDTSIGKDVAGDFLVPDTADTDPGDTPTGDTDPGDTLDAGPGDATLDGADGTCSELVKPCGAGTIIVTFDNLGCPLTSNSTTENGIEYHFVNPDNPCETNDKGGLFIGYSGTLVIDLSGLSCTPKSVELDMTEFTGSVSVFESIDATVPFATTPITTEVKRTPSACGKFARRIEIPGGWGYLTELRVY